MFQRANRQVAEQRLPARTMWLYGFLILFLACQQFQLGLRQSMLTLSEVQLLTLEMQGLLKNTSLVVLTNQNKIKQWRRQRRRRRRQGSIKYLLYITTVFSEEHQMFFRYCWPKLLQDSKLLQGAHVTIFSNNETLIEESILSFVEELFAENPSFRMEFASESTLLDIQQPSNHGGWMVDEPINRAQLGANVAVHLGFLKGWFAPYDWIIRINPDVLIRKSSWLLKMMNDTAVDGIFIECSQDPTRIHTDFFVIRPIACRPNAFENLLPDVFWGQGNHEITAAKEFLPIIKANRHRWLPDNDDSKTFCRVRGDNSSVIHSHGSIVLQEDGNMTCTPLLNFVID